MMEFGKSLQTAREAKGYSVSQLAEMTHLAPSVIEDLEGEDFSRIPAPIYGRGFVKLYCEAVGLEPKPFVDEFMEIASGNREPHIRERAPATPVVPEPSEAAPTPDVPQKTVQEAEPAAMPQPDLFAPAPEIPSPEINPAPAPADDGTALSRYAPPFRDTGRPRMTPPTWRLGVLALAGLAVLILLVLGIRSLYRATMPKTPDEPAAAMPTAEPQATAARTASAPRTPQEIPSLYLD